MLISSFRIGFETCRSIFGCIGMAAVNLGVFAGVPT
jgi:hypothetical protein